MTNTLNGKVTAVLDYIKYIKRKMASVCEKKEDPVGPLPKRWEKRVDSEGREYFANLKSKTTQWEDPRIHGFEDPLPPGWVIEYTGTIPAKVFVDLSTETCTYMDPRQVYNAGPEGLFNPVPYSMKLKWKLSDFHSLCECNKVKNIIKISFARESIFKDVFSQIMKVPPFKLRGKLLRTFKGEGGIEDFDSDWVYLLSTEVFDPKFGLFEYADKYENSVQINPASAAHPNKLVYFRFLGRFIAMALFHGKYINKRFTTPFYKRILGKKLTMKDIESIDPEFYNSLVWIKENDIDKIGLEIFFSVNFEILGNIHTRDLKPGGRRIKVTEKNKKEFIRLMTAWRLSRGQKRLLKAFMNGFNQVFPSEWLHYFNEIELEEMLIGSQELIDVKDWEDHTVYKNCSEDYIKWFWKYVHSLDYAMQSRLLQFVTGTHRVPVGGFAYLMGSYGLQPFCIQVVGDETWLPRSHTCLNRLDLPPYKDYHQFETKLTYVLNQAVGLPMI